MRDISHKYNRNASSLGMLGVGIHLSLRFGLDRNEAQKGSQGKIHCIQVPNQNSHAAEPWRLLSPQIRN